ncbi:MAG TPA: Holliday junction branch migration protein RuvA [Oligoflexia bacterium]|nr:Holliday junction branch migration protein RuvA [Oligoflexia bacterium]HMP27128.1 Holliday junction branch migration protein RuvA [Oligoflexia bacterium]
MISRLTGTVGDKSGQKLTIDVAGVGYEVTASLQLASRVNIGEQISCLIYTEIKDDAINLYGFNDQLEKHIFQLLLLVNGIGPKTAVEILSKVDRAELLKLIAGGNPQAIQSIKGIGKKLSERIIVELKDRVSDYALEKSAYDGVLQSQNSNGPRFEALEALIALGFSRRESEQAISRVAPSLTQTQDILRAALQAI